MIEQTNEDKILDALKSFGRLPSGRLAAVAGLNYDSFILAAGRLLGKHKIKKEEETVATYWELKK